jgi:hypothetical protein
MLLHVSRASLFRMRHLYRMRHSERIFVCVVSTSTQTWNEDVLYYYST